MFRRIRYKISTAIWKLRRNIQRFIRGWAYSDCWDIDLWFIEMMEPMLIHLQKNHMAHPDEYTEEEWSQKIGEMISAIHLMDRENVVRECFDGDLYPHYMEVLDTMMKNKDRFFELFSKDFFSLWD